MRVTGRFASAQAGSLGAIGLALAAACAAWLLAGWFVGRVLERHDDTVALALRPGVFADGGGVPAGVPDGSFYAVDQAGLAGELTRGAVAAMLLAALAVAWPALVALRRRERRAQDLAERLTAAARRDPLTGLPTAQSFLDASDARLRAGSARGFVTAVCAIAVEPATEAVLRAVAARLTADQVTAVARSDEGGFLLARDGLRNAERATALGNDLRERLAAALAGQGPCRVHVGVAAGLPGSPVEAAALVATAQHAAADAKAAADAVPIGRPVPGVGPTPARRKPAPPAPGASGAAEDAIVPAGPGQSGYTFKGRFGSWV